MILSLDACTLPVYVGPLFPVIVEASTFPCSISGAIRP